MCSNPEERYRARHFFVGLCPPPRNTGRVDKAAPVKAFLDPQIRAATESNFDATYTVEFKDGLPVASPEAEAFAKNLTRYGAGEAYVEAHAAPAGVTV